MSFAVRHGLLADTPHVSAKGLPRRRAQRDSAAWECLRSVAKRILETYLMLTRRTLALVDDNFLSPRSVRCYNRRTRARRTRRCSEMLSEA